MAGRAAGFAHARAAGGWLSASPRIQRLAAAHVAVVLGVALAAVAAHQRPGATGEPLALAAAGPASAPVAAGGAPAPARLVRGARPRSKPRAEPKPTRDSGWVYWSARVEGCESHGRPDAPPDYRAANPSSSASGAYQILDVTWAGRYGVTHASDAAPEQQEEAAADLYRRHGMKDWAASAPCWRKR